MTKASASHSWTVVFANLTLAFLTVSIPAEGVTVRYEIIDSPDATAGEDLWQYAYHVSDYTFNQGHGFTIRFEQTLYKNIEDPPPPVSGDWDVTV